MATGVLVAACATFTALVAPPTGAALVPASPAPGVPAAREPQAATTPGGGLVALAGSVTHLAGLRRDGALEGRDELRLDVVLRPRNGRALQQLANAVSTPGSPEFHHPISLAEFERRFGAPAAEVRRSEAVLHAGGFTHLALAGNGLVLGATASVATAERTFGVTIYRYADRDTGAVAGYAASGAPRLGAVLDGAASAVVGLDSLADVQPTALLLAPARPGAARPAAGSACAQAAGAGLSPAQVASAYGLDNLYDDPTPDLAAGASIAVVEFAPYSAADLATFASCYGLDASHVTSVDVDGGAPASGQGDVEADLDVEELLGLAPRASITVLEAPNTDTGSIDAFTKAVDGGADVVATSWGLCEAALDPGVASAENELFEQAAALGESVIAASGDEGSEDCTASTGQSSSLQVDDPASQPYVTGVGGTTLSLSPRSETLWNSGGFAGGGGISTQWPMPAYQAGAGAAAGASGSSGGIPAAPGVINPDSSAAPCKAAAGAVCREVPDVSADAGTPYGIYATVGGHAGTGAWVGVEGTSGAAPAWAALLALADESVACAGKRVGFANPSLYAIAAGPAAAAALDDITGPASADNSIHSAYSQLYPVTPGYDMATGLGSPIAGSGLGEHVDDGLVDQLCQGAVTAGTAGRAVTPPAGAATPGSTGSAAGSAGSAAGASGTSSAPAGSPGGARPAGSGTAQRGSSVPQVARLVPSRGPGRGGTTVVLHGMRLGQTEAVWFGSRRARLLAVLSPTRVSVLAPPGTGSVAIRVRTPYGTTSSRSVRYSYTGR